MSEMVERVARAIGIREHPSDSEWFDDHEKERWAAYWPAARDALSAMREPTEAMCEPPTRLYGNIATGNAEEIWQLMIDEALR